MFFVELTIEKMKDHVRQMPGKSSCGDKCLYRTDDGNRCLLGRFIPDELYDVSWESRYCLNVGSSLVKAIEVGLKREGLMPPNGSLTLEDLSILRSLQKCHDNAVRDVDGSWVDPSVYPDKWRATVIQRLNVVQNFYAYTKEHS